MLSVRVASSTRSVTTTATRFRSTRLRRRRKSTTSSAKIAPPSMPLGNQAPFLVLPSVNVGSPLLTLAVGESEGCAYTLSTASMNVPSSVLLGASVTVTTHPTCAWSAVSNAGFITVMGGPVGIGTGTVTLKVAANGSSLRSGTVTIAGHVVTIDQAGAPTATMALDKTSLRFGAVTTGANFTSQTAAQQVRLTQSGAGTVTWTATPNQPWLRCTRPRAAGRRA